MSGGWSYYYTTGTSRPARRPLSTSRTEIVQITIAYVVLSVDLLIIYSRSTLLFGSGGTGLFYAFTPAFVAVAATAAFTGFVAHELAHKVVAQRRGFWAEFRMWPTGLAISFFTAVIGFLWGAPGATVVDGMSTSDRADWGRTSIAGPLTNVAFGVAFLGSALATFTIDSGIVSALLLLAWINGWFGTFNLIPFGPLDGRKVLHWSRSAWLGAILFTGAVAVLSILALTSMAEFGTPWHCYQAVSACA